MLVFFMRQMDYIFFFCGLGFVLLAGICFGLHRSDGPRHGWSRLGWFALLQGLSGTFDLFAGSFGDSALFSAIRVSVLAVSFLFLIEFGRFGAGKSKGGDVGGWVHVPLGALAAMGAISGTTGLNASVRLVLGLGGGFWAGFTLLRDSRTSPRESSPWLLAAGLILVIYSMAAGLVVPAGASFLPSFWIHQSAFMTIFGFPVELLLGCCSWSLCIALWGYSHETSRKETTVQWSNTLMRGVHGAIEGGTSVGIDTIERNQAEEALRENERFLDRLIANIPSMILVKEAEKLRFVRFNKAWEDLLGYSREELIGKTDHELFPQAIADSIMEKDLEALRSRHLVDIPEQRIPTRFMGERVLHTKNIPILDDMGHPQYLLGISDDITERKRTEEERILLATMVEQSEENVLVTDNHRTILYVNPAFERSSGYGVHELKGQKLRVLRSDQHEGNFFRVMKETLDRGDVWVGVIVNRGKDGTDFEIEGTISPLRDSTGAITHYVAVGRNMSRFRKLERELQQMQKLEALGTLAGGVAHDFNNVLAAIMGFIELELMTNVHQDKTKQRMEQALASCCRAKDLVKQILTFSRHNEERLKPLDMGPLVKEAFKMLRATLPSTIELRLNLEDPQAVILGDPIRIHQVLLNLCTNAAYAMRDMGGMIDIGLTTVAIGEEKASSHLDLEPGAYVLLTVTDTGHGTNRKTLERVFEPFFTTKEQGEGTGMGLAVVHGIVKSHGGVIHAYSEPGKGSSFEVFLPWLESAVQPAEALSEDYARGNERILLVDDEEVVTTVVSEMLEYLGYRVVAVNGGDDALRIFHSEPHGFDLILTDLTMPGLTGIELAGELMGARSDIPVILCTGFTSQETNEQARSAGIRHVLIKPCVLQVLAETVRHVLDGTGSEQTEQ